MNQGNLRGLVSRDVPALKAGGHLAATALDLKSALEQKGLEVLGSSVARYLAHVPSNHPKEIGEVVFVEVFDSGENAPEKRYTCWIFSLRGVPLLAGKPGSNIAKAVDNLRWEDLRAKLGSGIY